MFINQIYHEAGVVFYFLFEANTWLLDSVDCQCACVYSTIQCLCKLLTTEQGIYQTSRGLFPCALYLIYMPSDSFDVCLNQDINIYIYARLINVIETVPRYITGLYHDHSNKLKMQIRDKVV